MSDLEHRRRQFAENPPRAKRSGSSKASLRFANCSKANSQSNNKTQGCPLSPRRSTGILSVRECCAPAFTPVFAQAATHHTYKHRNSFNQWNGPVYAAPSINDSWGAGERDRSRVDGEDPDFNPPGD
jgi:hypothetical protein